MPSTDPTYQLSLTGLFNLVSMSPTLTLTDKQQLPNPPFLVTGPYLDLAGNENYQQTVDLFAWSGNHTLMLYSDASTAKLRPLPSTLLAPENDPYQFVNATLSVTAACVDLYGNQLTSTAATSSTTLQWTDPLVAPAAWPGLSIGYLIEQDLLHLDPVLRLQLEWKLPSSQITETQRIGLMLQYARIYQQLARSKASLTCSILTQPITEASERFGSKVLNGLLQERVTLILDALYLGVVSHLPLPEIRFTLNKRTGNYIQQILCPLNTSLTVTMTNVPPVTSVILPQHNAEDTGAASIRKFASRFESALQFLGAKLMIGQTVEVGAPNLYFLSTGAVGMQIGVTPIEGREQTIYVGYAPQPLGLQTYTRSQIATTGLAALIANPNGTTNLFTPAADATAACTNLDVDVSMNGFLNTLDALLAPDMAVPASLIGDGILQQMIAAKEQIADTLSQTVLSLSTANQDGGAPLAAACQCYEQSMLRSASSFYNVDAIAVYSVSIANAPSATMNLFGHMELNRDDVTISPFNCSVSSESGYAPIAISVRTKGSVDELAMPTTLRIHALEVDLQTVTITTDGAGDQSDYTFGTWLEYAIPFEKPMDIPSVTVTLPLRACPQPVQLLGQSCTGASPSTAAPISQTLQWSLSGTYQRNCIAQDSLLVTIATNTAEADSRARTGTGQDIVDALALYNALSPLIAPYLGTSLQDQVPPLALSSTTKDAIAAFAGAANYIQQCLPVAARGINGPPRAGETYQYEISEGPASETDDTWVMLVHQVSEGAPLSALVPSIPGCQTTQPRTDRPPPRCLRSLSPSDL
jgi:hypothetical protein